MTVGSGVLPVVHDNRKKEPPDATAGCNDREPATGVRGGEGDAGRRTGAGRGLSPPRSPGPGQDHRGPGSSRAGWPRRSTSGSTPSTPAPCATGATAPADAACSARSVISNATCRVPVTSARPGFRRAQQGAPRRSTVRSRPASFRGSRPARSARSSSSCPGARSRPRR